MSTPKEEITAFLDSKEAGMSTTFNKNALVRAAESMFTSHGLDCPVQFLERDGQTYLLNRTIINGNGNG